MTVAVPLYSFRIRSRLPPSTRPALHFILLHGFLGHSNSLLSLARRLQLSCSAFSPDVCVESVVLDCRNHGRSPHTETHTLADITMDLAEWMRTEGYTVLRNSEDNHSSTNNRHSSTNHTHDVCVPRDGSRDGQSQTEMEKTQTVHSVPSVPPIVVGVGHSMGSMAWTNLLAHDPTCASALVSLDMPPIPCTDMPSALRTPLMEYLHLLPRVDLSRISDTRSAEAELARVGVHDAALRAFLTTHVQCPPPNITSPTHAARWRIHLPVLERSMRDGALFPSPTALAQLSTQRLEVPVLSLLGEVSPIGTQCNGRWAKYAKCVEEHTLRGAGHNVHYDQLDATVEYIRDFVRRLGLMNR